MRLDGKILLYAIGLASSMAGLGWLLAASDTRGTEGERSCVQWSGGRTRRVEQRAAAPRPERRGAFYREEHESIPEVPREIGDLLRLVRERSEFDEEGALELARAWADVHGRTPPTQVTGPVGAVEVEHE